MVTECIVGSLDNIGYVSIHCQYNGKWVLCYHKVRQSWEFPGGHVEEGEMPLTAAKRELYEETGATDFDIYPLYDYQALNEDGTIHNNGREYYAVIREFGKIPDEFEMAQIDYFDELPMNVTYNREKMLDMLKKVEKCISAFYI